MAHSSYIGNAQSTRDSTGKWIVILARLGFVAQGIVYVTIGALATTAALGSGGLLGGGREAIRQIGQQPYGQVMLALIGVGLVGYVVWRIVQAIADPDREGTDAKGLAKRTGFVFAGLAYALLAYTALSIAFGLPGGGTGGGSRQEWTAWLMSMTFGIWLVGILGAVVVGVGIAQFYLAYTARFMDKYNTARMPAQQRRWAERVGRFGYAARGVTFCIIGGFIIQAAVQADPQEAKGLGAAFATLAEQPYGPWLLAIVALGFVAFGISRFFTARYRHFPM
jgi:multisubunit Na+/H+ antiporter MnhC subunit